jgi:branched-chain amino acid transport system permease protein
MSVVAAPGARRWGLCLAVIVVLVALPHVFDSPIAIAVMNKMGIAIIFALSYNMMLGQGGMLSFGHAVYFGLGGFIAMHALNRLAGGPWTLPVPLLPLVGGLAGLGFGAVFGSFSTNRAGTVFAMISLGIVELVASSSLILKGFFGGEEGISGNRTKGLVLWGIRFASDVQVYYLIAFWAVVATWLMYAFSRTPIGRMANAVRDNPERAEFVGYSQRWVRFVSFCAAGFFAGIAGGLFAVNYEILTEEAVGLVRSGNVLLMTYIGGIGYFGGPIIGAVIFTFLESMLSDYTPIWLLYLGILFLATVLFVPTGFAGVLMMHEPARRAGRLRRLALPYLAAAVVGLCAAVGVIGLLEMVHFWSAAAVGRTRMRLFWTVLDIKSVVPWLVFGVLAVGGALVLRRVALRAAAAWNEATYGREDAAR